MEGGYISQSKSYILELKEDFEETGQISKEGNSNVMKFKTSTQYIFIGILTFKC